jgi:hypothetical protein
MSLDLSRLEKPRSQGAKTIARCPACAETGNDAAADHLFINSDGKFGCVLHQGADGTDHRKRIFELAGIEESKPIGEKSIWTPLLSAPDAAPFPSMNHFELGQPSAHWIYRTNEGRIAGIVARFETSNGKETRPLSWCKDQHGNTGWRWKAQADPRTIYGLPINDRSVVIVEGEKTAEAIRSAGLPATTWQGGSSTVSKSDWSPLAGKECFIWPDNDEPGNRAKDALVRILAPIASKIYIVSIPDGMPEGWDAADTTKEEILRLVDEAVLLAPSDYPKPESEEKPAGDPQAKPERKPLSAFLVDHKGTLGMSWDEIDALRPPYIIDQFLRRGEVMLTGAESKSRKSWLVQDAGFCVAAGFPWLADENGENGFATAQARVHVLDLELNPSEMRFRFAKARGNRFADSPEDAAAATDSFSAYSFDGMNVRDIMPMIAEVQTTVQPGDLVILDCLYRLVPDGNETADVAEILETVKRFAAETQAGVIVVDHFRKAGDDKARNRFAGSFVKQASASTLVAIETKADDLLVLNIDARTFHGCPLVHARFNLESYAFNRVPDADIEAARQGKAQAEAEGWILAIWKSKPLDAPATNADAADKWEITRQGATGRFEKLKTAGFVARAESPAGQAVKWVLTSVGGEMVKSALNLHPSLHP